MFNFLRPGSARPAQITPTEAAARASKGELVVIDVREVAEVRASGKAKGALVIPSGLVGIKCDPSAPDCPKGLSLDTPVALYCASGARSGMGLRRCRSWATRPSITSADLPTGRPVAARSRRHEKGGFTPPFQ